MSRRRVDHPLLWGVLLFAVPLLIFFGGCVRRMPGPDPFRERATYRGEVARARAAGREYLRLAEAGRLIRTRYVRDLGYVNLVLGTIRKCKDSCAKKMSIEEGADGIRLACGDNSISVNPSIGDDFALEDVFRKMRPVVRECASPKCRSRIDGDYERFLIDVMLASLDPGGSYRSRADEEMAGRTLRENRARFGLRHAFLDGANVTLAPRDPTPAFKAGIKEGDRIVGVGDRSVDDIAPMEWNGVEFGRPGSRETIWITRDGFDKARPFALTREIVEIRDVESLPLEEGIGYVHIHWFADNTSAVLASMLHRFEREKGGLKGLVLDLRSNEGGELRGVITVADSFIDSGVIAITKARLQYWDSEFRARPGEKFTRFPIAVLVNSYTFSGAEIVARSLQERGRATVVGVPTRGVGRIYSVLPMEAGSALVLPTEMLFTSKGMPLDKSGVRPDIVVEKGEAGDAQLDRAVAYLRDAISQAKPAAK